MQWYNLLKVKDTIVLALQFYFQMIEMVSNINWELEIKLPVLSHKKSISSGNAFIFPENLE